MTVVSFLGGMITGMVLVIVLAGIFRNKGDE